MELFTIFLLTLAFGQSYSAYVPGTPGGPWTKAEMLATKARLYNIFKIFGGPGTLRLAFHDCVRYADGTGGCDGCLNWNGVDKFFDDQPNSKKYKDDMV